MNRYAKKVAWLQNEIARQRKWIEQCESNGISYAGPRGPAIREADENALRALEKEVAEQKARYDYTV